MPFRISNPISTDDNWVLITLTPEHVNRELVENHSIIISEYIF